MLPTPALLALNNAHATELSELDLERFAAMIGAAFHAQQSGDADAFILAFDQDAAYSSPNYLWFRKRFARFVYVDRVVVAPRARRQGLARRLYDGVIGRARECGHVLLGCEVNAEPPNPVSDALHAALGFRPAGRAALPGSAKTVRYLVRDL